MAMYSCRYCRESFSVVSELKQHIEEEQKKQGYSTTYTCVFCSETRETVTEIKKHVQRCHHTNPFSALLKKGCWSYTFKGVVSLV